MQQRQSPDTQAVGLMVVFCFLLGMQQVALKAASSDVAPIFQIALRSACGAVLVWIYTVVRQESLTLRKENWKPGLLVGFLFAVEYYFLGEALNYTSASHTVVFLYTAPVFAALILHFIVPSERMNRIQWGGIVLAFSGTALAFLGADKNGSEDDLLDPLIGDVLAIFAGAAWGATTVVIRTSRLSEISPRETLTYQLLTAFLVLLVVAYLKDQLGFVPSPIAIGSVLFQSVFIGFLAFLIWFWLLRNYHSSPIGIMSFMTPVFGVLLGAWLLSEPLEPTFLFGSILVILGVVLVVGSTLIPKLVKLRRF